MKSKTGFALALALAFSLGLSAQNNTAANDAARQNNLADKIAKLEATITTAQAEATRARGVLMKVKLKLEEDRLAKRVSVEEADKKDVVLQSVARRMEALQATVRAAREKLEAAKKLQ